MTSVWRPGRPWITGNPHVDLARLPLKPEFLERFMVEPSAIDPAELAIHAFIKLVNEGAV